MKRKLLSITMIAVLCLTMLPTAGWAADGTGGTIDDWQEPTPPADVSGSWTDEKNCDTSWYDSTKSEFVLEDSADLAGLAKLSRENEGFKDKIITLKENQEYDLSAHAWIPIKGFEGTFNGNKDSGTAIKNMVINLNGESGGLFSYGMAGTIENVSVKEAYIQTTSDAGGIVARSTAGSTIENCSFDGDIVANGKAGPSATTAGGIVGENVGTVQNCTVSGSISGTSGNMGGIVGFNGSTSSGSNATVINCTNNAQIAGDGYTFRGWFTVASGGEQVNVDKVYSADTTLYAQWEKIPEPPYSGKYSYEIFSDDSEGGALDVDRYATEGEQVTITVLPDDGYALDEIVITDENGETIEFVDNGDGTITFTMPSGDVTITATFVESDEPECTLPFVDVHANDWFFDPVCYVYSEGLMTGTSATTFAPNATTTRAMIVSILARQENVASAEDAGFTDVAENDWFATAVNWAAREGIVAGFEDESFRPNEAITREQLAAILCNYSAWKGKDTSARADLDEYTDAISISSWATETMSWAVAEQLLAGVTENTLEPQGAATRAQVAAVLQRFLSE